MKSIVPINKEKGQRKGIDMIQRIIFTADAIKILRDPEYFAYPNKNRGKIGREYKFDSKGRFARMR